MLFFFSNKLTVLKMSGGIRNFYSLNLQHVFMKTWEIFLSRIIFILEMALSCFFWFLIAFLYEVLKAVRQEIIIRDVSSRKCTMPVSSFPPPMEDTHCNEHQSNGVSNRTGATNPEVPEQCPCVIEPSRSRMSPPGQELVEIQSVLILFN